MCGIAGIIAAETGRLDLRSVAEQMQSTLTHRGPDDRGLFISDNRRCALAHTRLSILDLSSAGHQPMGLGEYGAGSMERGAGCGGARIMSKEQGAKGEQRARFWITYNGEIYNYLQLRRELGAGSLEQGAGSTEQGARRAQEAEVGGQRSADQRSVVSGQRSALPLGDRTLIRK